MYIYIQTSYNRLEMLLNRCVQRDYFTVLLMNIMSNIRLIFKHLMILLQRLWFDFCLKPCLIKVFDFQNVIVNLFNM